MNNNSCINCGRWVLACNDTDHQLYPVHSVMVPLTATGKQVQCSDSPCELGDGFLVHLLAFCGKLCLELDDPLQYLGPTVRLTCTSWYTVAVDVKENLSTRRTSLSVSCKMTLIQRPKKNNSNSVKCERFASFGNNRVVRHLAGLEGAWVPLGWRGRAVGLPERSCLLRVRDRRRQEWIRPAGTRRNSSNEEIEVMLPSEWCVPRRCHPRGLCGCKCTSASARQCSHLQK